MAEIRDAAMITFVDWANSDFHNPVAQYFGLRCDHDQRAKIEIDICEADETYLGLAREWRRGIDRGEVGCYRQVTNALLDCTDKRVRYDNWRLRTKNLMQDVLATRVCCRGFRVIDHDKIKAVLVLLARTRDYYLTIRELVLREVDDERDDE